MIALFNKNNNGTAEIREHCSFLDANLLYSKISSDVEYETEKLRKLIGDDTYQRILAHYKSADYNLDPEIDPTRIVLNRAIYLIQAPVANFAYLQFAPNNDINHTGNGRTVHFDDESRPALEWQLDRAENSLFRKAHKQVDQLLEYLEEKKEILTEWKDSYERLACRELFLNSATALDQYFPIDESRWLYLLLVPFIRDAQKKQIRAIMGKDRYDQLLESIKSHDPLDDDATELLDLINNALSLIAVSVGLKRLSFRFFPDGVLQQYTGDRLTTRAREIAGNQGIMASNEIMMDAQAKLKDLQAYITNLETTSLPVQEVAEKEEPEEDPIDKKFMSL